MKASKLISDLALLINDFGDREIKLEILTDSGSYGYNIDHLDYWGNEFQITMEINDIKLFKREIK